MSVKLTKQQRAALDYCKNEIDKARATDLSAFGKKDAFKRKTIEDAQQGIVLSPASIITLRNLEAKGLIEIVTDNSGIGTGMGAFPSVVRVLNY